MESLPLSIVGAGLIFLLLLYRVIVQPLLISPLGRIPGPRLYAITGWRLAFDEWQGKRTQRIHQLHVQYGPVARIGPNEVHFNAPTALRTIYGAGSGFGRTNFYRMFDVYGRQNVFTFGPSHLHAARKKLLAHAYSKSNTMRGPVAEEIEDKIADYLRLIECTGEEGNEIFTSLHWYSLDNITNFLYGAKHGGTAAMKGDVEHQKMLNDILDPARRRLTWFVRHFPSATKWLYSRTGTMERLTKPFLPMEKPSTYTRIREHALKSMESYRDAIQESKPVVDATSPLIERLWSHHESRKNLGLDDLDIAAECSDHFLAGIDTTSDTLMFLVWALSRQENKKYQEKLRTEVRAISPSKLNQAGNPTVETCLNELPYLDAVVKETLRLYAPLPASEPREPYEDTVVDGLAIPARTTVSMAPYSLHRDPTVFEHPLKWNPERWLPNGSNTEQLAEMKRWWWAFSSGGRMCIGMHLALAEMALVPAIYRRFSTRIKPGYEDITPGITSRFEVFYDETFDKMEEHNCWIIFDKLEG
jgi:hypothetical protein